LAVFVWGLCANIEEKAHWEEWKRDLRMCPILFYSPLGLFLVMPRVEVCTEDSQVNYNDFMDIHEDFHPGNFGTFQGKIVTIDYE
jgi:hypothetical protein